MTSGENSDLLQGYEAIGQHLHMSANATKHRARSEGIPIFRIGRIVCARRSSLNAWLAEREAAARGARVQS